MGTLITYRSSSPSSPSTSTSSCTAPSCTSSCTACSTSSSSPKPQRLIRCNNQWWRSLRHRLWSTQWLCGTRHALCEVWPFGRIWARVLGSVPPLSQQRGHFLRVRDGNTPPLIIVEPSQRLFNLRTCGCVYGCCVLRMWAHYVSVCIPSRNLSTPEEDTLQGDCRTQEWWVQYY